MNLTKVQQKWRFFNYWTILHIQIGITTNYDYSFKRKLVDLGYSSKNNSSEDIYSLRRNTSILDKKENEICKIWNIHGEIDKPPSIMLGLDHYCGSIGKIDAYIKGKYEFQENKNTITTQTISRKIIDKKYDGFSWVELFFNSDIHIVGLSLDYTEIDLWWILNKRARLMRDKKMSNHILNNIFYYAPDIDEPKKGILSSFNVQVIESPLPSNGNEWNDYYQETLDRIGNAV